MKELYISPELEILCFLPTQGIASATWQNQRAIDDGLSTSESRPVTTTKKSIPAKVCINLNSHPIKRPGRFHRPGFFAPIFQIPIYRAI